jgi:kynurenine formamidase
MSTEGRVSITGGLAAAVVLAWAAVVPAAPRPSPAPSPRITSDGDVDRLLKRLTNWGRWGDADQRGTLNHLTPERVRAAAGLVREGVSVSLARPVVLAGHPGIRRAEYEMLKDESGSRDYLGAIWHGFAQTHLDALCHGFANPREMYNGIPTRFVEPTGCRRLGIDVAAERGIVGRGVLLDVAELKGAPLEPGTAILPQDLEEAARRQGVEIRSGDVLAVRTGAGARNTREGRAGLHPDGLFWLQEREIALLMSDGDSDVAPMPGLERWASPLHSVGIPYLGLSLIDNAELDELSHTCRKLRRWEFLVVVAPWRLQGATSAPVNPMAIF